MTDWKPIETAPKDGTRILAWDGRDVTTIKWVTIYEANGEWCLICVGSYAEDDDWYPKLWKDCPRDPE